MKIGVIPARINSKRFPKKILANLNGKPLVAHTVEQVLKSKELDKVVLAIDSDETRNALKSFDFDLFMTSKHHQSGTDRVAEVIKSFPEAEIVINIQGDEPLVNPLLIDDLVNLFKDGDEVQVVTPIRKNLKPKDLINSNVVKAIIDEKKNVIDFKRNIQDFEIGGVYRHIGMYGYRRGALFKFTGLEKSKREDKEKLEQLRLLDNKINIKGLIASYNSISVDTIDDLNKVKFMLKNNFS